MTEDEFYNSDLQECMLRVKGRVQEWRYARRNAWLIHASLVEQKNRISITDLPLPFDDELEDEAQKERQRSIQEAERIYLEATGQTLEDLNVKRFKGHNKD